MKSRKIDTDFKTDLDLSAREGEKAKENAFFFQIWTGNEPREDPTVETLWFGRSDECGKESDGKDKIAERSEGSKRKGSVGGTEEGEK